LSKELGFGLEVVKANLDALGVSAEVNGSCIEVVIDERGGTNRVTKEACAIHKMASIR
jgi:hypothetical protein